MQQDVQAVQERVQKEAAVVESLLTEVRTVIVGQRYLLDRMVGERVNAGSIMSSPVMTIDHSDDITTAGEMMTHFNINSIPVMDEHSRLAGIGVPRSWNRG